MSGLAEEKRSFRARGGAVIAYRMHRAGGAGRTLVLIHGLASNMSRWSEFAAQTSLQSSWNILRIDLRGQGGSVFRGPAGMDEWCEDLAGIVDAEGVRSAVLAGHCLGANLALRFAAAHPGRVAGLVLIEPMPRRALTGVLRIAALIRPAILLLAWTVRGLNALGLYRRRLETVDLEALDRRARAALAAGAAGAAALRDYASPLADLRSMPLACLMPLLRVPGCRFVSLQYAAGAQDEIDALRREQGIDVHHWPEAIDDYDQTAALVCALDGVASVCTAVVHLGGALGRPVLVLAPVGPEWRYGQSGPSMPWYPSVRILRQATYGEWDPVIAAAAEELRVRARQRSEGTPPAR